MNLPLLGAGVASWLDDSRVNAVHFWGSGTNSIVEFVYASNTADTFCILTPNVNATAGGTATLKFSEPQNVSEIRVRTLTAGTAWIYLA